MQWKFKIQISHKSYLVNASVSLHLRQFATFSSNIIVVAQLQNNRLDNVNDYDASDNELQAKVTKKRIGRHLVILFPQHSQVQVLVNL